MKNPVRLIQNQRGDALIVALMVSAISLLSSLMMMNYSRIVQASSRHPRVKSVMTSLEAKVRMELLTPSTYTCTTAGRDSCVITASRITSLSRALPGAKCPSTKPNCGVNVSIQSFATDVSSGITVSRASVLIAYEGLDIPIAPIQVIMDVPADILQATDDRGIVQCPRDAPKFNGFLANGQPDCTALPDKAEPGKFVNSIDPSVVKTTDFSLPDPVSCSGNKFISKVNWGLGGTTFSHSCTERADPFSKFGFTPAPGTGGGRLVYTRNPDYP